MDINKSFFFIAAILALELVVVLVLIPGEYTKAAINKEAAMIERSLGAETRNWVFERSGRWFNTFVIESGFEKGMYDLFIPTEEAKAKSRGLETFGDWWFKLAANRIAALMLILQQFFMRFAILTLWLPYCLLLLIPSLYDGVQTWKIKQTNFDYASPILHRYSVRFTSYIIFGTVVVFLLPFAISPSVTPILIMAVCVMLGLVVGNFQKRI